jgi:hypothetical protein
MSEEGREEEEEEVKEVEEVEEDSAVLRDKNAIAWRI